MLKHSTVSAHNASGPVVPFSEKLQATWEKNSLLLSLRGWVFCLEVISREIEAQQRRGGDNMTWVESGWTISSFDLLNKQYKR